MENEWRAPSGGPAGPRISPGGVERLATRGPEKGRLLHGEGTTPPGDEKRLVLSPMGARVETIGDRGRPVARSLCTVRAAIAPV